jgi:hypothetical protein
MKTHISWQELIGIVYNPAVQTPGSLKIEALLNEGRTAGLEGNTAGGRMSDCNSIRIIMK